MLDLKNTNLTDDEISLILSYVDSDIDDTLALQLPGEDREQMLGLLESNPDASAFAREVQMCMQFADFVFGRTNDTTPTLSDFAAWDDECRAEYERL